MPAPTTPTISGPSTRPPSCSVPSPARNSGAASLGATSLPSVSIEPEPKPLPIPMQRPASTTNRIEPRPHARPRPMCPSPINTNEGVIPHSRPKRSMTYPDTGKSNRSAAALAPTSRPIAVADSSRSSPISGTTTCRPSRAAMTRNGTTATLAKRRR